MNYTGTTVSTCAGFFQLGLDLDPHGTIAPWYVSGADCEANYFTLQPIPTPPGSELLLSIVDNSAARQISFTIDDVTIGRIFAASIPYRGSLFFGTYTQLEFQPCCAIFPI
jgi:hypothetical protein